MKILHLSDLHLGKRVFEYTMIQEQRRMLDWALALAQEADVTVIAGDIYDRQVPAAEAVALLDDFLTRMSAQNSPVLLISGNHDSAERIAFGAQLMDKSGIYVSPAYDGQTRCVSFADEFGEVCIHLLPFVKPAHVRAALGEEEIGGYTDAMRAVIARMPLAEDARHVLVAHQFVTGATRSDSEEVSVGGLDNVDAQVFAPFDYVALGHLHTPQGLEGGRVRYSGSPLCYAFGEAGVRRGALMVALQEKGTLSVTEHVYVPERAMRRVRGRFDELLRAENGSEDYVQVTLTDESDVPDAAAKLFEVYPNLMQVLYDNARTRAGQADFGAAKAQHRSPMELFEALYLLQNGAQMDAAQRALLAGMMERIWEDEA